MISDELKHLMANLLKYTWENQYPAAKSFLDTRFFLTFFSPAKTKIIIFIHSSVSNHPEEANTTRMHSYPWLRRELHRRQRRGPREQQKHEVAMAVEKEPVSAQGWRASGEQTGLPFR